MYPISQKNEKVTVEETYFTMSDGTKLYTRIIVPQNCKKCPVVFSRTPYEKAHKGIAVSIDGLENDMFVKNGYAVITQHCRGRGDSEGDCVPYGYAERTDALDTLDIIRTLPFYNGEIYLYGGSYLATVHFMHLDKAAEDIKGAVLSIQTDRMYFRNYRNGCCFDFCNVNWYVGMLDRRYPNARVEGNIVRPYKDISKRVFGEEVPELTAMYTNHEYNDFWKNDPRDRVIESLNIPVLFTDGWYDFYLEGMFSMWERLPEETKKKSAFVVGPWGHAVQANNAQYPLPHGNIPQDFPVKWFDSIRNKTKYEYAKCGAINYYSVGGDYWTSTDKMRSNLSKRMYLGADGTLNDNPTNSGEVSYKYDPDFRHGKFKYYNIHKAEKATGFDGIISFYSQPFCEDTSFFGNIRLHLNVSSDCEDTAFFSRIYLSEGGEDYNLTETIVRLSVIDNNYKPNSKITIDINTPPIAFTVKKGCGIRVDISSDGGIYVPHANVKGHWAEVNETRIARNTVICNEETFIELPII